MAFYFNQVGYLPNKEKFVTMTNSSTCQLFTSNGDSTGVELTISHFGYDSTSGDDVYQVSLSSLSTVGDYYLVDEHGEKSFLLHISNNVYEDMFHDLNRMLYFQRCGCALDKKHAGPFMHAACHTAPVTDYDDPNHKFILNGGWHDAGDYGRYVTPGAVTVAHLLYSYSLFHDAYDFTMNLPETGNGVPDILNECRYELDWMFGMQFSDGSVSHKLTSMHHADFVMPEDDLLPFVRMPASSLATADFAACMALASRIWLTVDVDYSRALENAALKAWSWLEANPTLLFENPADCRTGSYGDSCDLDERMWAATELYRITEDEKYLKVLHTLANSNIRKTGLGWGDVSGFAGLSILFAPDGVFDSDLIDTFRNAFTDRADNLLKITNANGYRMSLRNNEFFWGSNMDVMVNAVVLLVAKLTTGVESYASAALDQIHYLLGRNPLGISYVTGYGSNAFRNPHNRPTFADGVENPIPGYVSGGPNKSPSDAKACSLIPSGTPSMKCYVDAYESYSTNEIAIYWNSITVLALVYFVK